MANLIGISLKAPSLITIPTPALSFHQSRAQHILCNKLDIAESSGTMAARILPSGPGALIDASVDTQQFIRKRRLTGTTIGTSSTFFITETGRTPLHCFFFLYAGSF